MNQSQPNITSHIQSYRDGGILGGLLKPYG